MACVPACAVLLLDVLLLEVVVGVQLLLGAPPCAGLAGLHTWAACGAVHFGLGGAALEVHFALAMGCIPLCVCVCVAICRCWRRCCR